MGGSGRRGGPRWDGGGGIGQDGRSVIVQWDCGNRYKYRCGEEGKYDLSVFDSGPTGE